MFKRVTLILLSCLLIRSSAYAINSGDALPDFSLPNREGQSITSDNLKGSIIVVDFWASWCPPCKLSLPRLNQIANEYADRGVKVVLVSVDHSPQAAREMLEQIGIGSEAPIVTLFDATEMAARLFNPPTMPTTFIFDRSGHVVFVHHGFKIGDEKIIEQEIEQQLNSKKGLATNA